MELKTNLKFNIHSYRKTYIFFLNETTEVIASLSFNISSQFNFIVIKALNFN